jgi:ubiquilin
VFTALLMQDMGFYDQESNIRALQATGGNVNAAVDRLLQNM